MKKRKLTNYRGLFSKDILPKRINNNKSIIDNFQDYFECDDSHWIIIYNVKSSDVIEYYDSFGLQLPYI